MKIPVIFRRYYAGPLIALFPTEPADYSGRYVMSYQSIGQHGAADYEHVMKVSTETTPWEYSELKAELEAMGHKLRVVKRASKKQHEKRIAKARKIWAIMAPTIPFAKRNPGASSLVTMGLASGIASGVAFGVTNHILAKRRMNNPLDAGELDSLLTHAEEMTLEAIDAEKKGDLITAHALASVAVSAASISGIYGDKSAFKKDTLKMDAEVFLQNATEMRSRIERKLKGKTMSNPRTTKAELNELVEHLKRITGLNYHIGYAYGKPRLYLEEPKKPYGAREVSPRLPKGQLKEWMYAYMKGIELYGQMTGLKKEYPAQNPAAQYNPLTQAQIGKLIKSREKGRVKNSATRILINGQNFNIETGQALPRGTNVMYHMVYWGLTRETANMIKDFVQKQNPGQRVTMDYQAGSATNPGQKLETLWKLRQLSTRNLKWLQREFPQVSTLEDLNHAWDEIENRAYIITQPGKRLSMKAFKELQALMGKYGYLQAKNPERGGLLKKRLMRFLKEQYGDYVEDWQNDAEVAIYWFANDYHGGQWTNLYSVLSTSPYSPGPISTLESEGEVVKMMYQGLVDEFGQAAKNPEKPGVVWPVGAKLYDGRGKLIGVCLDTPNAIAKAMMEHPEIEAAHTVLGVKSRADYASRMQSWNTAKSHFKPMANNPGMKFKDLDVGSVFIFASEREWWSRGMAKGPWVKVSPRMYSPEDDKSIKHRVGTVNVEVVPYSQAQKGYRAPSELPRHMTADEAIEAWNANKVKLDAVAEALQRDSGKKVPRKGTKAYKKMYEKWVNYLFRDFPQNVGNLAREFARNENGSTAGRKTSRRNDNGLSPGGCVISRE